tara:strand:- start:2270 stop:2611 length:342 start_codon:yes stop_codon:yes gene_type:complete
MAVSPGTYDFTLQRGSDHKFNVVFKDSGGSAINLTGWTAAAQVWDEARTTKAADFAVTYVNRANGSIDLAITDVLSAAMTDSEYKYDVLLTDGNGLKEYYLEGTVFMNQGYTR